MLEKIQAIVFDMDGTLVDSALNFDLMRSDLGFPINTPILEYLDTLDSKEDVEKANKVIHRHEINGAKKSILFDGVKELLALLKEKKIPTGILTRNSSIVTEYTLKKFELNFDVVLTRDDCKAKPNPEGLLIMGKKWNIPLTKILYVGDYLFDLQTAKNAKAISALYLNEKNLIYKDQADILISSYYDFSEEMKFDTDENS
ncbi:MAG: HAD superfamily hydrolase (TIGR01549 family) [Thermoproteota archaeon]|jgi:HAD superfamily hydrolase (TIGR01549 family)